MCDREREGEKVGRGEEVPRRQHVEAGFVSYSQRLINCSANHRVEAGFVSYSQCLIKQTTVPVRTGSSSQCGSCTTVLLLLRHGHTPSIAFRHLPKPVLGVCDMGGRRGRKHGPSFLSIPDPGLHDDGEEMGITG